MQSQAGALRAARWAARAVIAGALLTLIVVAWSISPSWLLDLWRAVLAVMAAGCWALTAVLALSQTRPVEQGIDFALALVSVAFALFSIFAVTDEGGSEFSIEIVGAVLVLGAIGLIVASAAGKRRAQQWRNTESTDGRS